MYYPPPQQVVVTTAPAGRSFTRAIFTTLATTVFAASLALNLYLLAWSGLMSSANDSGARQNILREGDLSQKVGVISIKGVIDAGTYKKFDKMLTQAEADANLKAIVIDIDTPGGGVTASDQIYARLQRFRSDMEASGRTIPIVATIGSLGTSGGYYVACATDYIFAERTGLTGNIGVLMPRFNLSKLAEKHGVEETTIVSRGAPYKNAGSMFQPENERDNQYIQQIADDAFAAFKDVVKTGRANRLTAPLEQVADGRAFFAPEAARLGLIDATGTADDAFAWAANKAGLSKPHVVRFEEPPSFLSALSGQGEARTNVGVTFEGRSVSVDAAGVINDLLTPRLMYLWRGD
jgi:protease-4